MENNTPVWTGLDVVALAYYMGSQPWLPTEINQGAFNANAWVSPSLFLTETGFGESQALDFLKDSQVVLTTQPR